MKNIGFLIIGFAALNLLTAIIMVLVPGNEIKAAMKFIQALMCGVLGAYLIHRANKKEEEKKEKQKWENEE